MKTSFASTLRLVAVAATLTLATGSVCAKDSSRSDVAAELLARQGTIPLSAAGRYVERGTPLIQVEAKLGQPAARLADGTWLYPEHNVENSEARGTLVVHFDHGRVGSLSLVTPAVATAMMAPTPTPERMLAASNR